MKTILDILKHNIIKVYDNGNNVFCPYYTDKETDKGMQETYGRTHIHVGSYACTKECKYFVRHILLPSHSIYICSCGSKIEKNT